MGILKDILNKRDKDDNSKKRIIEQDEIKPTKYNKIWLERMSNQYGYIISDDKKKVDGILGALNRRDGHCPCGGNGIQFLCPCVNMRERGLCKCGLYENKTPVNVTGNSSGRIK